MTDSTSSSRPARLTCRPSRAAAVMIGIAAAGLLAVPSAAQAAARAELGSSICSSVSASSVSAIVGYRLPAATFSTVNLKATKTNDEISAVASSCTYGAETSMAALPKTVVLSLEVTSRSLTTAELKKTVAQAQSIKGLKMTITPYSGLGMPALYFTFSEAGITAQGISALNGTKEYGANVFTKTASKSEIAALVKLAEKL